MYNLANVCGEQHQENYLAGQGPSRRELLQALSLAATASMFAGFSRWSYALAENSPQPTHTHPLQTPLHPAYRPQFLNPNQYQTVELLADLILPATPRARTSRSTVHHLQPGAKQAGVAEFIDFIVFSDPSLQPPFQSGLAWLDKASAPADSFHAASAAQQTSLLERLAYKAKYQPDEKPGQDFFKLFRKYTVIGFYTTRMGLESLDYPGLTFYATSPGCTHQGNPEHVGL